MSRIAAETRATAALRRRKSTAAERRIWGQLKLLNRQLGTNFRRQTPIGFFIAGFAEYTRRIVIECDAPLAALSNPEQDAWLRSQGFRVLRFSDAEIAENPDRAVQQVLDCLGTPLPLPPHKGEGSDNRNRSASPPLVGGDGGGGGRSERN